MADHALSSIGYRAIKKAVFLSAHSVSLLRVCLFYMFCSFSNVSTFKPQKHIGIVVCFVYNCGWQKGDSPDNDSCWAMQQPAKNEAALVIRSSAWISLCCMILSESPTFRFVLFPWVKRCFLEQTWPMYWKKKRVKCVETIMIGLD